MKTSDMMSWIGSVLAITAVMQGFIPRDFWNYCGDWLLSVISPYTYFVISQYDEANANDLYVAVQTYLSSLTRQRARKSNLSMAKNAKTFSFSLSNNQRIYDNFEKVGVEWMHTVEERKNTLWMGWSNSSDERRAFQVKMPRRGKDFIVDAYFSYIVKEAKVLQRSNRDLNLYSNRNGNGMSGGWSSIPFKHPASFDTVALDPEQKSSLLKDLDNFLHGEEFYRRVGKAWKRGYLLFGPPGTGKTSIIAAIANHLRYDVYDLELTEVRTNSDLRKLLLRTSDKSIIVIEDIDCSLDLSGQRKKKKKTKPADEEPKAPNGKPEEDDNPSKVTLSGLLNFTDGLWSACGSERIFIFTTNYVNKLDPALLRPGRMDMHIKLGYCRYPAFVALARNFLQIKDHPRFADVQQIIDSTCMSPAEIAEILTKERNDPDLAIDFVVKALRDRKSNPPAHDKDDDHSSVHDESVHTDEESVQPDNEAIQSDDESVQTDDELVQPSSDDEERTN